MGVPVLPHRARKVRADEYDEWDLFVYMDDENERHLSRIFGSDPETKCVRLLALLLARGWLTRTGRSCPMRRMRARSRKPATNAARRGRPLVHRQL